MIAKTDLAKLNETLLTMPGMNVNTKIDLKIPLRNALLLSKIIERGLLGKEIDESSPNMLDLIPRKMTSELLYIPMEILQKAALIDMSEKLKSFAGK